MATKWMMGTAAAALIAASPAFAQTTGSEAGNCALEEMTNDEFVSLDVNEDSSLSMDEYRQCLDGAGLSDGERADHETAFDDADQDSDSVLAFAEIEQYGQQQASAQPQSEEIGDSGRPQGTVTVTQPAADVTVRQPAPEVTVSQGEPTVNVEQKEPEVSVQAREPEVTVSQPEPQVAVSQPEPEVSVSQPEPDVSVSQAQPEVAVQPGQPAVDVEAAEPEVAVETPNPDVRVEQPEVDVNVQQAQPEVAVEQAQPEVAVERSAGADVETATDEGDREQMAATTGTEPEQETAAAEEYRVRFDDIVGKDVYNAAGDEVGDVQDIVLDPNTNRPMVIVKVGGFLGLGGREVPFAYDDVSVTDDQVVLDTAMTEDELDDMPEYDETAYQPLPETMIVR